MKSVPFRFIKKLNWIFVGSFFSGLDHENRHLIDWLKASLWFAFVMPTWLMLPYFVLKWPGLNRVSWEELLLVWFKIVLMFICYVILIWLSAGILSFKDFVSNRIGLVKAPSTAGQSESDQQAD